MSEKVLDVRWMTYPLTGEQGWATVDKDDGSSFIYYGPDGLDTAAYQAYLTNRHYGHYDSVEIHGPQLYRKPYRWMS